MRLRDQDALYAIFDDLLKEAMRIPLNDAERLERWKASCHDLLKAVPDQAQKLAFSMELAQALSVRTGVPIPLSTWFVRKERP